jgi:hypothetical protein
MGKKGAVTIEGLCCVAVTEVIILELDLLALNLANDMSETEQFVRNWNIGVSQDIGWTSAIQLENEIAFTCCDKPFSDYGCRVAFRNHVSYLYGSLYVLDFAANVLDRFPERLADAAQNYITCMTEACANANK